MIRTRAAALAVLAVFAAAPALAQALTPTDIVNRHMAAASKGDADAMAADYADDAVVLTAGRATQGKAAIGAMFKGMLGGGGGGAPAMSNTKVWAQGDVGFVSWEMNAGKPNAVKGTDSFLVKNGKIVTQAVFIGEAPPAQ